MAVDSNPSFDDLETVDEQNGDDYDAEWIDLEPGDSVTGELRARKQNCGEFDSTILEIAREIGDVVCLWSNSQIESKFDSADVQEGQIVGIKKTERTAQYSDEDTDEPEEYNIFEVRVMSAGGD